MEKITREKIQSLCIPQSYDRGVNYFQEGRVRELDLVGEQATGKVQGTRLYEVRLDLSREDFGARCSCPYDWGGYCKHIVAVLLQLGQTDLDAMRTSSEEREQKVKSALQKADEGKLKEFLKQEFEGSPDLQRRFLSRFGNTEAENSLQGYKSQVRVLYTEVAGPRGLIEYDEHIDFSPFHGLARRYSEDGNVQEAAKVYRAVSEVIADEMDRVDDSTGYYGDEFGRAIGHFTGILSETDLDFHQKKPYIDYLFEKFLENDPDYFQEYYEEAIKDLCSSQNDYQHWKKLLQPHLPEGFPEGKEGGWSGDRYEVRRLLSMQANILENLDEQDELNELFERTYREDGQFCLRYVNWLANAGQDKKARGVAERGLETFGGFYSRKLRKVLIDLYEGPCPEKYKENLKQLYLDQPLEEYYRRLKSTSKKREWEDFVEEISAGLSGGNLIKFHILEGNKGEAFDLVVESESLNYFEGYLEEVADYGPKAYFEAYADQLTSYLAGDTGRRHYRQVIGHLRELKKLGLTERFREYVNFLIEENANRPAFLDELSSSRVS